MPYYIILALSAFLLTLLGTRLTIVALRKRTAPVDVARIRDNKPAPAPSGGGIVIVFALITCLLSADISYGLILAILLLAAISLLHGVITIPLPIRILVHIMAVIIPLSMLDIGLFDEWVHPTADKILTGVLWVWFINIFASMDEADGLCAIEAISITTGLCLIAVFVGDFPSVLSVYSLIFAASLIGFLWWNWPPAKVYMGDVGAVPVAFLLGYLLLLAANNGYHYTALILPAYILTDGFITHIMRFTSSKRLSLPYYYNKARENDYPLPSIARAIIGINILLVFLALRCVIDPENALLNAAIAYMAVFMLLGYFRHLSSGNHDKT